MVIILYFRNHSMSNKTPYEIRLDLVKEAREILQARAKTPEDMPTTEQVLHEADRLNDFVSKRPNER
jgi:hypothetical protein